MYSQNNEERIIGDFFGDRIGRFLDVGAYDGLRLSNVRRLLDVGWSGVMVEPSPSILPLLRGNVSQYGNRVKIIDCAIGSMSGEVDFYDNPNAVATTSQAHLKKWRSAESFSEPFKVTQITPEELLNDVGTNFDFISIDVESTNIDLVRVFPWHRLPGLRLVCVEHDSHQNEMINILGDFGFERIAENPENLILSR